MFGMTTTEIDTATAPKWANMLGAASIIGILAVIAFLFAALAPPTGGIVGLSILLTAAALICALIGSAMFFYSRTK